MIPFCNDISGGLQDKLSSLGWLDVTIMERGGPLGADKHTI